jgi:heme/copper-type cytochrome/quinol oxidase subunit 2
VFWVLFAMLAIVVLAALVVVYVAYPYRGRRVPKAGWVGDTMARGVEMLPTLDNQRH